MTKPQNPLAVMDEIKMCMKIESNCSGGCDSFAEWDDARLRRIVDKLQPVVRNGVTMDEATATKMLLQVAEKATSVEGMVKAVVKKLKEYKNGVVVK